MPDSIIRPHRASSWARGTHRHGAIPLAVTVGLIVALAASWVPSSASEGHPWRRIATTAPFPPTLEIPVGAYDPLRHRALVLDVGYMGRGMAVHALDLAGPPSWAVLELPETPSARIYLGAVAYDPVRDRLLLIGSSPGTPMEVWALSLGGEPAWRRLPTTGNPPSRGGHSAVYDPVSDRVLVYGGVTFGSATPPSSQYLSEVWALWLAFDAWSQIAPTGVPPGGREGHGAIWDPVRNRMLVFGGHFEAGDRGFWNDTWELGFENGPAWHPLATAGAAPGARSAFGTVYDPIRRRMLVHGGVNAASGIEPDDLWALALDGSPEWTAVATENALRGRSYPVDVYDPVADRLLACGGAGYAQASELPLAGPARWSPVLPTRPPGGPSPRSTHAVVHDPRRDRFIMIGGNYASADSAVWYFAPDSTAPWQARAGPATPGIYFDGEYSRAMAHDSTGDRVLLFDGYQAWSCPAAGPQEWTRLGPHVPSAPLQVGWGAAVALDTRRNRLIVSGGYVPYPHSAGYTLRGVWALTLGTDPAWEPLGTLPYEKGAGGLATFYDPVGDRLVVLGGYEVFDTPRSRRSFGSTVWTTALDSTLAWELRHGAEAAVLAPPDAHAAYDPVGSRLFTARDTSLWMRAVDGAGPWVELGGAFERPQLKSAIAYDPSRGQVLALLASSPGSDSIQAWAISIWPPVVSLLEASRASGSVTLRWRATAAHRRACALERREDSADWLEHAALDFDVHGLATYSDRGIRAGHDYSYRVRIAGEDSVWYSEPVRVLDLASQQFALLGAFPNPAVGRLRLDIRLPDAHGATLELFDVQGRRRLRREVGQLGPGRHVVGIEGSSTWSPGVYLARLVRGRESRAARLVLIR